MAKERLSVSRVEAKDFWPVCAVEVSEREIGFGVFSLASGGHHSLCRVAHNVFDFLGHPHYAVESAQEISKSHYVRSGPVPLSLASFDLD